MYYKNPNLTNPDSAMPIFLNTFLPPVLSGMITLFILFAMLNQIAYIGTGGLIAAFVGPTIMRVFVEADLPTCLSSMIVGFLANVILVFTLDIGWVEAPIISGVAGSVVYLVMGYISNGMARKAKVLEIGEDLS